MMPRLEVQLGFRHPSGFVIDAAFDADDGVTALVGPSGSGKSTILQLIAGLLRPLSGRVRLNERTLVDVEAGVCVPPEGRRIGMVFQEQLLFPHLTVRKNLEFGAGREGAKSIHLAKVVEVLEIGDFLERYPPTLSGGQRQRVALGRALLRGPDLLLLDEPLAALDEALKERLLVYLEKVFNEWRMPTLFVCHESRDVERLARRVVTLNAGRIV